MEVGTENENDEQPAVTSYMDGMIVQFLRRNYFLVQLRDRHVVAAMPEELLSIGAQFKELKRGERIDVKVRLRKPPRMARIVSAHRTRLI